MRLTITPDYRLLWLVPTLGLFLLGLMPTDYEEIKWAAILAAFACMVAIHLSGYSLRNLTTLYCATHMLIFPLAVFVNLPSGTGLPVDLWEDSHYAMYVCAVGVPMCGLGSLLVPFHEKSHGATNDSVQFARSVNIILTLLAIPLAIAEYVLGVYYHSSANEYNYESSIYLNVMSQAILVSRVGVLMQVRRYMAERTWQDGLLALILTVISSLTFLPSGNRESALGFIPPLLLYFMVGDNSPSRTSFGRKLMLFATGCGVLLLLLGIVGVMRADNYGETNALKRLDAYYHGTRQRTESEQPAMEALAARFADYVACGRIVADTPTMHDYRSFDGMAQWWQIVLPGAIRMKLSAPLDMNDGANQTVKYGVSSYGGGSSPITVLGDYYERFGISGVACGMFIVGVCLKFVETRVPIASPFGTIVFFWLAGKYCRLPSDGLLGHFVLLTREFLVWLLIAHIMSRYLSRRQPSLASHVRNGVSCADSNSVLRFQQSEDVCAQPKNF